MTIQINEPISATVSGPDGETVVLAYPPCQICQHRSGAGPCQGCQPAGSGITCLPCYYRGPVPVSPTPPMPGVPISNP